MPGKSMPLSSGCKPLASVPHLSDFRASLRPGGVQTLLGVRGVAADQAPLTELADVAATIERHGARVDQLAGAVAWLRVGVCLWYKNQASAEDLIAWPAPTAPGRRGLARFF